MTKHDAIIQRLIKCDNRLCGVINEINKTLSQKQFDQRLMVIERQLSNIECMLGDIADKIEPIAEMFEKLESSLITQAMLSE